MKEHRLNVEAVAEQVEAFVARLPNAAKLAAPRERAKRAA
jgi:hypothetical protein